MFNKYSCTCLIVNYMMPICEFFFLCYRRTPIGFTFLSHAAVLSLFLVHGSKFIPKVTCYMITRSWVWKHSFISLCNIAQWFPWGFWISCCCHVDQYATPINTTCMNTSSISNLFYCCYLYSDVLYKCHSRYISSTKLASKSRLAVLWSRVAYFNISFSGVNYDFNNEVASLTQMVNRCSKSKERLVEKLLKLKAPSAFKPLMLVVILHFSKQLTGIVGVILNLSFILQASYFQFVIITIITSQTLFHL